MRQLFFVLVLFLVTIFSTCEKWDLSHESFPEVFTGNVEVKDSLLIANLFGEIKGLLEEERVENHGHLWTDKEDDLLEFPHLNKTSLGKNGNGIFVSELPNLAFDQNYYYRSYVQIGNDSIQYGEIKEFHNSLNIDIQIDSVIVIERTSTLINKVEIYLNLSNLPFGLPIQDAGFVMSDLVNPNINDHFSEGIGSITSLESVIFFTLTPKIDINKDHYFKAYVIVNEQIHYGQEILFYVTDIWIRKVDFAGGHRRKAVGFSIGDKGYIGTGLDGSISKSDFWEYDPSLDQWTQKADFAGSPRYSAVGFSIGEKGYIGGGLPGANIDFWQYDPSINQWNSIADVTGGPRFDAVDFSIGNKGYTAIGSALMGNDIREYDPILDQWIQKANFVGGFRESAVGFSIGNKGYVGLGSAGDFKNDFWEYDPSNDQWTQKANFAGDARSSALGISIGGKGYVGIGSTFTESFDDFWEYDPSNDQWTQKTNFVEGFRESAVGFSIGNKGYIGTGSNGGSKKDFWEYIPEQ